MRTYSHGGIIFKRAETAGEFEQIERLNHNTFAMELGQHAERSDGRLADRFHAENTYFVAMDGELVAGMVAVRDQPPFSIENRLADRGLLNTFSGSKLEVRLLAIAPEFRNRMLFAGLLWMVFRHALSYEWLLISGAEERADLYHSMGFQDLGPPVSQGRAAYRPMILHVPDMPDHVRWSADRWARRAMKTPSTGSHA